MSIITKIKNILLTKKDEDIKDAELDMIHKVSSLIDELHEIIVSSKCDEPEEVEDVIEKVEDTPNEPLVVRWVPPDLTLSPHAVHEGRIEPKVEPENIKNSPSSIVHSLTELNKKE